MSVEIFELMGHNKSSVKTVFVGKIFCQDEKEMNVWRKYPNLGKLVEEKKPRLDIFYLRFQN